MDKDNWNLVFMLFGSVLFCIFYIATLKGCAKRVVYRETYIPIKCDVEIPTRPSLSGDLVSDYSKALQYSETLEKDLEFCVKGK